MLKIVLLSGVLAFCFNSFGIFNLKTNKEEAPKIASKSWVAITQGCHSCAELLTDLTTFCNGKKPSPKKLGFLVSGSNLKAMLKKVKDYKQDYEIFSGSPNEFYQSYQISTSPSLKTKTRVISGKNPILKALKKDKQFCLI